MLRLVVRRAYVQRRVLGTVVLLVALATTLLGVCTLLLDETGPRAFSEQIQRAAPDQVDVTAYAVDVSGSDLAAARLGARDVVRQVLAPLRASLVSTATSRTRRLGADQLGDAARLGYLATSDSPTGLATLTSGRWPDDRVSSRIEAVAPEAAARVLHLHLGDRVTMDSETGLFGAQRPVDVVVVGTFRPASRAAWASDPLSGAGFDPAYSDGSVTAPTYGPFMVGPRAFHASGSNVTGLRVDAHPDLAAADEHTLRGVSASLDSGSALLSNRLGSSARITRLASELPETLRRLDVQQATTRFALVVVLLLGTILALTALLLAGRLVADSRAEERELLTALGLGGGQQVVAALLEAALLAAVAAIVAVPAAALVHSALTHLPSLETAGLTQSPTVTSGLVVTVLVGAVLLTTVLVLAPMVAWETVPLSGRRRAVARSGVDVLLLLVVVAGWWEVHSRPPSTARADATLLLAPVLCLTAATVLAVRVLPPLLSLAGSVGSRSRALLPLSLRPAALRLSAATALVLLSLAAAAATFGVALHATWQHSQADQADLRVGTDLSLALASPPTPVEAAAVTAAIVRTDPTRPVVSAVTSRPVAMGRYVGDGGDPPELVALDARHAGDLLRGRLDDGTTWTAIGRRLTPGTAVRGISLPTAGAGVELRGRAPTGAALTVTPSLVVQDAAGLRSSLEATPLPLDGRSHPLQWPAPPAPGQAVVAVHLLFSADGAVPFRSTVAPVSVQLRVPDQRALTGSGGTSWQARSLGRESPVLGESISLHRQADATVLTARASLQLDYLAYTGGELLATAFTPPLAVPVAVSQRLLDVVGTKAGGVLSATVGDTEVLLRVVAVVPAVPSAPGRIAVLADGDALSRVLIGAGRLEPVVDAFWVAHPTAPVARTLSALKLGDVSTRAGVAAELTRGPMQVTVPLAYQTLAVTAALMLLAGAALVVSTDQRRRSAEVACLRALGLTRRHARRFLLSGHAALLVPLVLTGVLVGGAAALALNASLIRSDQGTAPVPPVVLAWPWVTELVLAGGCLLGSLLIAAIAAWWQVRRSDTTQLGTGGWR